MWLTNQRYIGGYPKLVGKHLSCARHYCRYLETQRWKWITMCTGEPCVLVKSQRCINKTLILWKRCYDWDHGWGKWKLNQGGDISSGSWRMKCSWTGQGWALVFARARSHGKTMCGKGIIRSGGPGWVKHRTIRSHCQQNQKGFCASFALT